MTKQEVVNPDAEDNFDVNKAAVMKAAEHYESIKNEMNNLFKEKRQLQLDLESARARIEQLEFARAEAYSRIQELQTERDESVRERDEMRLIFHSFRAQLDSITLPFAGLPSVRIKEEADAQYSTKYTGTAVEPASVLPITSVGPRLPRVDHNEVLVYGPPNKPGH